MFNQSKIPRDATKQLSEQNRATLQLQLITLISKQLLTTASLNVLIAHLEDIIQLYADDGHLLR